MPTCDFYALGSDLTRVLDFVFQETDCEVYPLSSAPGRALTPLTSRDAALAAFAEGRGSRPLLLQLYSPSMAGGVRIVRVALDPRRSKGAEWREDTLGWGLIQLYLGAAYRGQLASSHTGHYSEAGARRWEATSGVVLGDVSAWNWRAVSRMSGAINRRITSIAVSRVGSRPVLPEACAAAANGQLALARTP